MGTFRKTLSLVSFAVGTVITILVYAQYAHTQSTVMKAVADRVETMGGGSFKDYRSSSDDDVPSLSMSKVAAPKNGSEMRNFEIVYDEEAPEDEAAQVAMEAEVPSLPEDATFGEKVVFYFERVSAWLFGERKDDGKVEMSCTTKRDGGKVCTVARN